MQFKIVIPARYGSSRLPGKPLLDICGKPMVQHVWERAQETGADLSNIWIATDDQRIADVVEGFGGQVVLTATEHLSGTDRLAEVANMLQWHDNDIVVNVQGDEPLIPAEYIQAAAERLHKDNQADIATLCCPIDTTEDIFNPNCVKVVQNAAQHALYFSRAAIPWDRDNFSDKQYHQISEHWRRHLGLYAYRVATLKKLASLTPAPIEILESLEQLRALYHGIKISLVHVDEAPAHGVDTHADADRVRDLMQQNNSI